jgi:hypothetical protein
MGPKPGSDPNMIYYFLDDLRSFASLSFKKQLTRSLGGRDSLFILIYNILPMQGVYRNEVIACCGFSLVFFGIYKESSRPGNSGTWFF